MAKRKRRKKQKPNLPEATLARARQQLAKDAAVPAEAAAPEAAAEAEETASEAVVDAQPAAPTPTMSGARRTRLHAARARGDGSKRQQIDPETVKQLLHNPTIEVTRDELREQYHYVIQDLRGMGIVAAILVTVLIAVNLILL